MEIKIDRGFSLFTKLLGSVYIYLYMSSRSTRKTAPTEDWFSP
jgi:hypothetical protein